MLLMVEKGVRGGICEAIDRYVNANDKCMKKYDKNKESTYLKQWDINNLYGWKMPQNLTVNELKKDLNLIKTS